MKKQEPKARISARTTSIDFSKEYSTKYCIPIWLRDEQIRLAIKKVKGRVQPYEGIRQDPVAVVGFGPSLKETWQDIRRFRYVISCSGAHKFLLEHGIVPTWHIEVDPREHKIQLLGTPDKRVIYLPSSTSHPKYLDHILASGAEVLLWHVFTNEEDGSRILPQGEWAITGGADAGLRALVMARFFGFRDIHVFGMDGSAGPAKESHAAVHPNPPPLYFECEYPEGSGRIYHTTPGLLACAKSVPHEVDQLKDTTVTFYGKGMIQDMMKSHIKKNAAGALLGVQKEPVISEEYRALNQQLHDTNSYYGTSGVRHVETVIKLAESIKTQSILDYGCGKGLLAKGLPFPIWEYDPAIEGKQELPRPADLVVCTDVLEHIEPDRLRAVLQDLARCTRKVGYFTINTGPAKKFLPDGRNAHLIQKDKEWWAQKLSAYFDIAKIFEEGPEIRAVVGPRTAKPNEGLVTVTKGQTSVTFATPNEATRWRANSLFDKEPCTIQWIETFQRGDVLWDIGANMGGYTVWAGSHKGVEVYAFEPEANNYALLCKNIRRNHVNGMAFCCALSDMQKLDALYCSQPGAGSSCHSFGSEVGPDLNTRTGVKQGAVGMTLDLLAQMLPVPTHIKIDVDGFEHLVIAGGKTLLQDRRVKSLLIEVNTNLAEHQEMVSYLSGIGFTYDKGQAQAAMRTSGVFQGCAEHIFTRVDYHQEEMERYVLQKIEDAEIIKNPFPHLLIRDILPKQDYEELINTLPKSIDYLPLETRGTKGYPERSYHTAPPMLSWMTRGKLRDALDRKFGLTPSSSDEILLLRDRQGYKIPPHTDTPAKAVTMLVYLDVDHHGTTLYKPKKKGFTDPEGMHHPFEQFTAVKTASASLNSALIFARTDTSFHGVPPYPGPGERNILLYDSKR